MECDRVGILLRSPPVEERRQISAAAEPGFGGDDEAGVHMHRRDIRIVHMRDQRNTGSPEPRIIGGARNLRAKLRRELAVHRRAVHADLLEQPAAHHRHHAAAAGRAGVVGALPWRTHEAPRAIRIKRGRRVVFEPLEGCADVVAQRLEPAPRPCLAIVDDGYIHVEHLAFRPVIRAAFVAAIAVNAQRVTFPRAEPAPR